ncbi:MAG: hypothetical protein QOJ76_1829 [Acidobacteriota bacterium]|nr:hypothetical protein [Acidobacteriota bacterium]
MRKFLATAFALSMIAGAAVCADARPSSGTYAPQGINHRQRHQQRRIAQGVRSGELTRGERRRLERNEREIRRDERQARADGRVTRGERRDIRRDLNHENRRIYRAKHNRRDRY